jgi:hypothetical protein
MICSLGLVSPGERHDIMRDACEIFGGDDETRTRDLRRDRVVTTSTYNNLQGCQELPCTIENYAAAVNISGWRSGWRVQRNSTAGRANPNVWFDERGVEIEAWWSL